VSTETNAAPLNTPRSSTELFLVFTRLALQGFGGVLPVARHTLVERQRWMSIEEFTDVLSRCQALPGPNIINMSVCIGARHFGLRGSIAAVGGLLAAPLAIVLLLGVLYANFAQVPAVAAALRGTAAVAAGLIIGTALRMSDSRRVRNWRALFGVAAFLAVFWLRLPLAPVLLVLAPLAILAARYGQGTAQGTAT